MKWRIETAQIDETDSRKQIWLATNKSTKMEIPLYVYLPYDTTRCENVLFSIHGAKCNADFYRSIFIESYIDKDIMIIAPLFSDQKTQLNFGNILSGNVLRSTAKCPNVPPKKWSFRAIDEIFRIIKKNHKTIKKYSVFGHSAGAQFAHRMVIFFDSRYIETVVAANAGAYTVLDRTVDFPFGIKNLFSNKRIRQILQKKFIMVAGRDDVNDDQYLPKSDIVRKQGLNRFERAKNFYSIAKQLSCELNANLGWRLICVDNVGHSAKNTARVAVKYLFR